MPLLTSEVYSTARLLLNDISGLLHTDAVMLPAVQKAVEDLALELIEHDAPATVEDSKLTVAAGVTSLTASAQMPADVYEMVSIDEAPAGSLEEDLVPMVRQTIKLPARPQGSALGDWIYEEGDIRFVGATESRLIRLRYFKPFTAPTSGASQIAVLNARQYLSEHTASILAASIGENYTRAEYLEGKAQQTLEKMLRIIVKGQQGLAVRRRPWTRSR